MCAETTTRTQLLTVIYDGECPFCANYVRLYRLRQLVGRVQLVDARGNDPVLQRVRDA
jgi:predicted DCC family thiol-disulfide oxidoreductase YuxK